MPLLETKGAGSAQGFGLTLQQATPVYIEEVFSTWLYTGNGSTTQAIPNGVDLSTYGGLVWEKVRNVAGSHYWSTSGINVLSSNTTAAASGGGVTFTTNGYTLNSSYGAWAASSNLASWTFRKQPKFFDVVTWTGNGANPRQIAHNLGSVPGCIIVKSTTRAENWTVYHRSLGNAARMALNTTDAQVTGTGIWASTTPTSTHFTVSADNLVNFNGDGYVAYLFAHDAGGFGLTGTDNVISCGSFTGGSPATVNLGYEPQWLLIKSATNADNWYIFDTMRGWTVNYSGLNYLIADSSGAENTGGTTSGLTNTGFNFNYGSGQTFVYIAIRRGPMKTPTSGTSVFSPNAYSGTGTSTIQTLTTNFPVDAYIQTSRQDSTTNRRLGSRLTGQEKYLLTDLTAAEQTIGSGNGVNNTVGFASNTGIGVQGDWNNPSSPAYSPYIMWNFRRAPGFFDVVCYAGNGLAGRTVTHNLGVAPELLIVRRRAVGNWLVQNAPEGPSKYLVLNSNSGSATDTDMWSNTAPTSSVFTVGPSIALNGSGSNYVAYLFASCPGVSKVGSYTGNGSSQTLDMGFTGGARFFLVKRTDSTGDWWVYDSARGIVAANDPALALNNTNAEVTSADAVDATSVGLIVNQESTCNINVNGGTYIFLAIA